jgi:hypothetical protein
MGQNLSSARTTSERFPSIRFFMSPLQKHLSSRAEETPLLEELSELCGSSARFALLEALPAKYRTALRWLERHGSFPLAAGADGLGFHSLVVAAILRQSQRLGAFTLAVFAAFRFVFELFIVEEELFASGENEIGAAIHTLENFVLEVHLRVPPYPAITPRNSARAQT